MKTIILLLLVGLTLNLYSQEETPNNPLIFNSLSEKDYISSPSLSFDGNFLIFVVKENEMYKFYESKKDNTNWTEPTELKELNTNLGEETYKNSPVYNFDASKIYFEAQNDTNTDIFVSSRTTNGWSTPEALPSNINSTKNEGEPSISPNDNILYFVRFEDEKDKECGKIYISKKDENFEWSQPKALLSPLNIECERTPRVLSDNKTLIFASKREGEKKFKFYYAKNLFSNIWINPMAVGTFTKEDNYYPAIDYKGETIIFASSNNDKKSELRIANLPKNFKPEKTFILSGKITNTEDKPIAATISLLDPTSIVKTGVYANNSETGEYTIFLPLNSEYVLDFSSENYSHQFVNFNNKNSEDNKSTINAKLFNQTMLYLNVYDKEIYEPFDVNIVAKNAKTNTVINTNTKELNKGKYLLTLPIGEKYKIELTSEFSDPNYFEIDLSGTVIFNTFEKNIEVNSYKAKYTFQIIDSQNGEGIECDIILKNQSTSKEIVSKAKTNSNGEVTIFVRKGDVYDLTINPHGYAFYNETIEITDNTDKTNNIKLQPLIQDVKIELSNITFETNSAELNVESYTELDNVVILMNENPEIKVEISAHTDDVGSDTYNQKLSEKRAKSVVDYLIRHEVDKTKLISKGYGEKQPILPNSNDENRAKNRRVELKIIEVTE